MTGSSEQKQQGLVPKNGKVVRFGAFVMTYNRAHILGSTIQSLLAQSFPPEVIIVIDNASSDSTEDVVQNLNLPSVEYLRLPENLGPSGAAAAGIQWAIDKNLDWVYWGDDDNPPSDKRAFEHLFQSAETYGSDRLGAVGLVGSKWDWNTGEKVRLTDQELSGLIEVDTIGGGGTFLLSRKAFASVDPPCEKLFFGLEESEYCLRIRQSGLKLVIDGDEMLRSRRRASRSNLTSKSELRHAWQVPVERRPSRQYYSTRNYIYMMRHIFDRPGLARRQVIKAIGRSLNSWRYGPLYGARFTLLQMRAVFDGYTDRMGRTISV